MSEHTSNTTSGPDGEEWERAVGAARTLLSSDCGWLELFTRAILEEKGVPYGKGLPNPEAPHIPEDKEIEEETMPGQGEPTPTAPEVPAGRHAAEPIRSGIPADAGETGNGYENPPEDATDRDDTLQRMMRRNPTPVYRPRRRKTDLGRDESGDLDPARARDVSGQFGARMRRSETYYPNLAAFVERFVANVFCYHQSASVNMQWVSDWWRYPALVFPLDAMWRAYENARKAPGQMMIFYIQAASMLDRVFDKDRGIVASLDYKQNLTRKGEPLPCERPNRAWREPILETLSVPPQAARKTRKPPSRQQGGETMAQTDPEDGFDQIMVQSWNSVAQQLRTLHNELSGDRARRRNAPNAPSRTNATSRPDGSSNPSASNNGRWTTGNASTRGSSPP